MHNTFIIGSIFNVPLHPQTAFLGPLRIQVTTALSEARLGVIGHKRVQAFCARFNESRAAG